MSTFAPWKVLHVELNEGIPTLSCEVDCQGIYVVFWWHGIPLGHQEISAAQLPMSAEQLADIALQTITPAVSNYLLNQGLRTPLSEGSENTSQSGKSGVDALMVLAKPLAEIRDRYRSMPASGSVSVVICTRDRPERLAGCLRSLENLSQQPEEILVIDNAPSSDATRSLVTQIPGIRYIMEPRPGLDIARNTGVRNSTGEIIAFTDDDVTVHPDWIARLRQSFNDPKIMAVTGLVLAAELETEAQFMFEKYWSFSQGYSTLTFDTQFFEQHKYWGVPVWRIGAGANMAFRRRVFELVGDFDERLDVGAAGCSGDSEFWYRVLAEGWTCRYEPTAAIYHYHRRDLDSLKYHQYHYLRGHVAALFVQFERYKHWGNLRRLFVALPSYYVKRFLIGILTGFKGPNRTLLPEVVGCFSGVKFYLLNQAKPK